ncbi:MAG: L,D-transpeptidase, partial [Deltaproteobacteria bacterium]|nr:L,D-transpeptidase [Deltaproteobacteria bacterium]
RPNTAPPIPETDLFAYAGGDPIHFYDPLGLYKIEIQLPHWGPKMERNNFRDQHGILILRKNNGHPLMGPFKVLGRSSNEWKEDGKKVTNQNKNRDPVHKYGDTPTGIYEVGTIQPRADKKVYGPHRAIQMVPVSGDASTAAQNGRSGLLIHGGRDSEKTRFGDNLVPTKGCIRMHDKDILALINEINRLKKEEHDEEGTIDISEYSLSFGR